MRWEKNKVLHPRLFLREQGFESEALRIHVKINIFGSLPESKVV